MVLFPSAGSETALDGMVACLSSFIKNAVMNLNNGKTDNLEIEAKFGALIDRGTSKRIFLPVLSECVINYEGWSNFVSDMPVNFHKRFNEALNARVSDRASGWKYLHTRTVDKATSNGVRVTVDQASGKVVEVLRKRKLDHMMLHFPSAKLDVRITVSVEDILGIADASNQQVQSQRHKDRLSYEVESGEFRIDLTQVMSDGQKHELEVEVLKSAQFVHDARQHMAFISILRELTRIV